MARHDARVEAVEPTGVQIVPGAVFDHHMVVDAVALRLLKRPVGDLVHADRARRRLIPLQGIPRRTPPPVGPRHGVASPFAWASAASSSGGDDGGRMFAEERAVFLPGLGGAFVERVVQGKEDFGRFVERVIRPVDAEPEEEKEDRDQDGPQGRRR